MPLERLRLQTSRRELWNAVQASALRGRAMTTRDAAEIRLRSERRLGEMLAEQKAGAGLNEGGRPRKTGSDTALVSVPTLAAAGTPRLIGPRAHCARAWRVQSRPSAGSPGTSNRVRGRARGRRGKCRGGSPACAHDGEGVACNVSLHFCAQSYDWRRLAEGSVGVEMLLACPGTLNPENS